MNYQEAVEAFKRAGGDTRHAVTNEIPCNGYMVGIGIGIVSSEPLTVEMLEAFSAKHSLLLRQPDLFLGTWGNDGNVYLDIARQVRDLDAALAAAIVANEAAIWDVAAKKEIWV